MIRRISSLRGVLQTLPEKVQIRSERGASAASPLLTAAQAAGEGSEETGLFLSPLVKQWSERWYERLRLCLYRQVESVVFFLKLFEGLQETWQKKKSRVLANFVAVNLWLVIIGCGIRGDPIPPSDPPNISPGRWSLESENLAEVEAVAPSSSAGPEDELEENDHDE